MSKEQTQGSTPNQDRAFSRMKEEIEAQAEQKANNRIQEAKAEAEKIIEKAETEAESIKSNIIQKAKNEAEQEKIQKISRVKQSSKMDYLKTRESVIDEIMVEARSELQQFTKTEEYQKFLMELVKSTGISMDGGNLNLHLRTEDKGHFTQDQLDEIASEVGNVTGTETSISVVNEDLDALGGIKMFRDDNRLFIDNTFESRIDRSTEDIRVKLLDLLG